MSLRGTSEWKSPRLPFNGGDGGEPPVNGLVSHRLLGRVLRPRGDEAASQLPTSPCFQTAPPLLLLTKAVAPARRTVNDQSLPPRQAALAW